MRVPDPIRRDLRGRISEIAARVGWLSLPARDRSRLYQEWTEDPAIGGVLSRFLSPNQIRTYIKDTLVKPYARAQLGTPDGILPSLGIDPGVHVAERYARPPGLRLGDGRVIGWGRAEDWKQLLMAVFERAFARAPASAHAVVLQGAVGRWEQEDFRALVEAAAERLGISRTIWRT